MKAHLDLPLSGDLHCGVDFMQTKQQIWPEGKTGITSHLLIPDRYIRTSLLLTGNGNPPSIHETKSLQDCLFIFNGE